MWMDGQEEVAREGGCLTAGVGTNSVPGDPGQPDYVGATELKSSQFALLGPVNTNPSPEMLLMIPVSDR